MSTNLNWSATPRTTRPREQIKVIRYDLPTLAVNVKPDYSYYLIGQAARARRRTEPGSERSCAQYRLELLPTQANADARTIVSDGARIVSDGARIEVTGAGWMDHEFGTNFLEPLQLDEARAWAAS